MSRKRKDKRAVRVAIVKEAMRRSRYKEHLQELSLNGVSPNDIPEEVTMFLGIKFNKISDKLFDHALKKVRTSKHRAHPRPRVGKQRYFRVAPHMSVC